MVQLTVVGTNLWPYDLLVQTGPRLVQVHTYPVGTWNSSESASKCFATHKNGTHLHCVLDPRVTLGPWLAQVHTYPVGTWNSSESAPKCFATHKNGTHLHWYTPTLWVHGTAQSLPQSALQLTRMAPISIGQLVHTYPVGTWNSSESAPKCFATHKNGTHLHCVLDPRVTLGPWLAQVHTYPVGTWNSSESAPKCFATHKNGTHLHCVPNPRVTLGPWLAQVHTYPAQSLPQSALQLTRMAPISIGQLVHTYPVGTWNSSESAPKCFATHKNGTHLHWYTPTLWVHGTAQSLPQSALQLTRMAPISIGQLVHTYPVGTWNSSESASKCFATHKNGTHLHCVLDPRVTLGPWLAQVHTYPVGTWNSSESASKCFATHKNGTQLHWYTPTLWVHGTAQSLPQSALQLTRMAPISIGQLVHTYPVGTWNSSESAPKCFATHKNGTHLHCVLDPRVTLGPWLAQVHTYPVGTWNSSESAPKCFATHKNGTHLHCVPNPRVTLGPWLAQVHTYPAQSLPQSALQLTRMAPISIGQLVHTYPVGTWNSSESAPKCFATHKNGTHLHWYTPTLWVHGTAQSLPQSALQLTRMAPISIGQLVHTYPVGTWNSSESASKCFATHKNGTHLHCVLDPRVTLGPWLAQVHTYPVGTWNSSESASKCFATHKNGTQLHWSACTHIPCGYMEQLRVCPKVLCNSQEWHPSPLVSLYTPTLWVHGTAQSLPQSALQLTRMAPISIGQLVHTYPVGTWNSSESAPKCFATHKNGTHLHWYTPNLWVHGTAQSLPQSALQLTRMAPISIGQLVHTDPVGTWNSSESAPKCFATHKNGTHLHCVLDPRVTFGPWLAQVHTYPVGTWNSSESAPKCFATHKNGTHLHCVLDPRETLGPWLAQVHTYPVGTWNSSESASKCFATHKNGTQLHWSACTHLPCGYMEQLRVCLKVLCNSQEWHPSPLVSFVLDPRVTLGPWLAQVHTYPVGTWNSSECASKCTRMAPNSIGQLVHTYPVGTWNSSESASKCFATHKNGTHLHCVPNPHVTLGPWLAQVHTYLVGTWNSSESAPKCFATHKNGTIFTGQLVHTYPVGTWNSSESASKCFATHKNGTHLHWYTPTLWVNGTAQSLPQSALQLTRMAPISIGQLVHTYPVGTWNSSECASKCFATHKNGTHLHCVLDPRVTLGPWLAQVHTYPVGTWNSSESAPKCFATHKNGTHLHWYTPTLWVHGTACLRCWSALRYTGVRSGIRFTMLKSEAEKTETTTEENVDDALKLACRVESAQKQLHNSEAASATETKVEVPGYSQMQVTVGISKDNAVTGAAMFEPSASFIERHGLLVARSISYAHTAMRLDILNFAQNRLRQTKAFLKGMTFFSICRLEMANRYATAHDPGVR
eukprot:Em0017g239a